MTSLRAFLAVAEELHFGRAAARLHSSVPTVSQHVKRLENQFGFTLVERSSRRVELTPHGHQLVVLARRAVEAQDDVVEWRRQARSGRRPVLRVGFWSSAAGPLSTAIFTTAVHELGHADVQLRHLGWAKVAGAVLDGQVDVAFMREPLPEAGLRHIHVWTEPRVLAVRRDHPLGERTSVAIADTANEVFVAPAEGSEEQSRFWLVDPRPDGSRPRTGPVAFDFEEILELVAAGAAVNITGASAVLATSRSDIVFVPIVDIAPTRIMLVAREASSDPLVIEFERLVERIVHARREHMPNATSVDRR